MVNLLRSFGLSVLVCATLSACSWHDAAAPAQDESYQFRPAPVGGTARAVVDTATAMVGAPYRYGGRGPEGFDCSGLVYYASSPVP